MHRLLARQIERYLGDVPISQQMQSFLDAIDEAYAQSDTDRAMLERSLDLSSDELGAQAQALARSNAELEQFAYVASHDLQEPLRTVQSYLQLLQRRYADKLDADANEFVGYAVDAAKRMRELINDLLVYARVSSRAKVFELASMNDLADEVFADLKVAIVEAQAHVGRTDLPTVLGDRRQLGQLLQNLIANAIKFRGDEPPRVHVSAQRAESEWAFSVQDNGIGLDAKYADKIFVIFQRLHSKDEYAGTGIGLAVCKKIVERHRGRIWVESEPGKGATFHFTVPIPKENA